MARDDRAVLRDDLGGATADLPNDKVTVANIVCELGGVRVIAE